MGFQSLDFKLKVRKAVKESSPKTTSPMEVRKITDAVMMVIRAEDRGESDGR